jgi:hypothetical protein
MRKSLSNARNSGSGHRVRATIHVVTELDASLPLHCGWHVWRPVPLARVLLGIFVPLALWVETLEFAAAASPGAGSAPERTIAAAKTLAGCMLPLARQAEAAAAKSGTTDGLEKIVKDTRANLLADKRPTELSVGIAIESMAKSATSSFIFAGPELTQKAAQCVEAACASIDDHLSKTVCNEHALELRSFAKIKELSAKPPPSIGMTVDDVESTTRWGHALETHRTITADHVEEQRTYSRGKLYFEDGILKAIQE